MARGGFYSLIIRYMPAVSSANCNRLYDMNEIHAFFFLLHCIQPKTWEDARVVVISQNRTQPNITLCNDQTYEQEQSFKLPASM